MDISTTKTDDFSQESKELADIILRNCEEILFKD
jgi:hypothetical protein